MVGRVSEGLAPGFGGIALVSFALGTLVAPLGSVLFDQVPTAALALGAFLLAWNRRPVLSGLLSGAAVLVEYEAGLIVVVLAAYLALTSWRSLRAFVIGLLPGVVVLGAYDWAAFGAPWHLSYRYEGSVFKGVQSTGFFGIGLPHAFGVFYVFSGGRGLLVVSPVLVMAALGLVRLSRTYRREALVAGAVTALFVLLDCGYFDPYGGGSPGPRYLVAGLPFLAVGLGPAYAWRPRLTLIAALASVIATTVLTVTWTQWDLNESRGVWGELLRLPSTLHSAFESSSLSPFGLSSGGGALLVALAAAAALVLGIRAMPWAKIRNEQRYRARRGRPSRPAVLVTVACAYLVIAANVMAFMNSPYGAELAVYYVNFQTAIMASPPAANLGEEVNFAVSVTDVGHAGAGSPRLTVHLSPGMRLVGPPAYTRGTGCTGETTLLCDLGFLSPNGTQQATVNFGVRITKLDEQQLTASTTGPGAGNPKVATYTVTVGTAS
jgi:hypothetical protein